jgi:ferredoxin
LAQFFIDNNLGRAIDKAEALKILDLAEESGLVLSPSNSQELAAVCCCCPCCCPVLKYAKLMPRPADMVVSYYQAKINPELCSSCGVCLERCQVAAIKKGEVSYQIVDGRCIGCGLCVSGCPTEAILMVTKLGMEPPPKDFLRDTLPRIKAERHAIQSKAKVGVL